MFLQLDIKYLNLYSVNNNLQAESDTKTDISYNTRIQFTVNHVCEISLLYYYYYYYYYYSQGMILFGTRFNEHEHFIFF
jgi:hypothetical protein